MSFTEIPYVNDYMALSIVSVVCSCCCFFVGLVAFYKTIEVKNCILYFSYPPYIRESYIQNRSGCSVPIE